MVKTKAVAELQRVGILVSQGTAVADVIRQIGGTDASLLRSAPVLWALILPKSKNRSEKYLRSFIAPFVLDGPINHDAFKTYVEQVIICVGQRLAELRSSTRTAGSNSTEGERTVYKSTFARKFQASDVTRYFSTVLISRKCGRNETKGLLRPNFGSGAFSEVQSPRRNPFETNRNSDAHSGRLGVCDSKLAEGKVLAANSLYE